jgi:hypothetical protein
MRGHTPLPVPGLYYEREKIMSIASFETEIVEAAKIVTCNKKLRKKDLREWSTGKIVPRDDERVFFLGTLQVYVSVLKSVCKGK